MGGVRACAPLESRGIYCSVRIFCMMPKSKRMNAMLNRILSMRRRRWSHFRRLKMRIHNFHKRGNRALPSTEMLTFVNKCCQHLTKSALVNAHDGTAIFCTFGGSSLEYQEFRRCSPNDFSAQNFTLFHLNPHRKSLPGPFKRYKSWSSYTHRYREQSGDSSDSHSPPSQPG